jgi:hypothetical protein
VDAFGNAIGDSLAAANSSGGDSWSGAARSPMVDPGTGAYSVFNNTMPSNNFAGVNAVMADAPDFGDQGPSRVDRSQDVRVAGDMTGGMSFGPYSGFGPSNAPGTDVLQVNPENGRLGYDQGDGAWVFPISSSSVEPMDVDQQQNNGDSIQAAPGLLRNLGSVAGAYLNGKVSLSAALSIANTQVGGIDNLGIDAIRALPNAAIGLVEFGLNVVGQGLMPGDLGATSLPRFDYTGKTGSWGPDIAMALPLLLGARRATTAEVATEIDRLAGLRKTHDGKVPAQIPDGRLAEADPFNTAVTGKAADLYSQVRPYSGDPAASDFVGPRWIGNGTQATPAFNTAGAARAAKYNAFQQGVSLNDTVSLIAGENPVVSYTTSGKTIYANPNTSLQVVFDNAGNYLRVENTSITGPLRYTDQFGKSIPANVPLVKPSGTTQIGVPSDVRNALTHFSNTD